MPLKIALLYAPPWKIAAPGEPAHTEDGQPADYQEGDLDPDFHQTPFGLFTLGAEAMRAGHSVKVINLSGFSWSRVVEVVRALDADLFGLSCWTANRRGVALVSSCIKKHHPAAHVVVGGPHATPLATELLTHHADIDTIALGESELTFLELAGRIERAEPTTGIAGTVFRHPATAAIETGPPRASIHDLDSLASPHDYFDTHIVMTSRGCPWQCTFCGADTTWGRGFRGQTVPYVLDGLEAAATRLPVKMIQIKDDTFTANRKRAMDISRGIRQRKLSFLWSCDTRVDVLSEDLLREMRLAGCERLSLGVESGSAKILSAINKKIGPEDILEATRMAKAVGIRVRYYMMLGNRGETAETFHETLRFLEAAQPHEYIFSCLSIYPGTLDFQDAEKAGWLDRSVYFSGDFQEYKTPFDATPADAELMNSWFYDHRGIREVYRATVDDCRAVLARIGEHHAGYMDLAGAHFRAGELDDAERAIRRALELGHPLPGLGLNYLACIAFARGDLDGMMDAFSEAARRDPQHAVLIKNVQAARTWFKAGGPDKKLPLHLEGVHEFSLLERNMQPTLPGPLPEDFARWEPPPPPRARAKSLPIEPVERGKLRVVAAG